MVEGILQTIFLLLRCFMNFKTCLHSNLEFTLVALIVDALMLLIYTRIKAVIIWYSQRLHEYLTSVCLLCLTYVYIFSANLHQTNNQYIWEKSPASQTTPPLFWDISKIREIRFLPNQPDGNFWFIIKNYLLWTLPCTVYWAEKYFITTLKLPFEYSVRIKDQV